MRGGIDWDDVCFRPRIVGFAYIYIVCERFYDPGMGMYRPSVQRGLDLIPRGTISPRTDPMSPGQSQPIRMGFPRRAGRYETGGSLFSSPGGFRSICDPGMTPYHPRVRRDIDIVPRKHSRGTMAPLYPANHTSAGQVEFSFSHSRAVSTRGVPVFVSRLLELEIDAWKG